MVKTTSGKFGMSGKFGLSSKYEADEGEYYFTGTQALVRVPFEQLREDARRGLRTAGFVSGYQGSPLGGFDRELAATLALFSDVKLVHRPGLNEELAATAVMGSQTAAAFDTANVDGVLGVWYGKAPGLDRAGDAIRHANFAGTSLLGGVLALTGDDPACKSSTLPSSSERMLADLHLPTLVPGTVQEVLDFGRHGVALSRTSGLWTAIKIVTAVADGAGTVQIGPGRVTPVIPTLEYRGAPYIPRAKPGFMSHTVAIEEEFGAVRIPLARMYAEQNPGINEITVESGSDWIGVAAAGRTYYELLAALQGLGLGPDELRANGIRLLRLGMVYPLDGAIIRRFAHGLDEVVVVEEKRPFLEIWIKDALYGTTGAPRVVGKTDPDGARLIPDFGALEADALAPLLVRRLTQRIDASRLNLPRPGGTRGLLPMMPSRTPFFCSGCPHSTGTKAPTDALVGSGIGCHGMVGLMDPERVGTVVGGTQMGGEGVQWLGIAPFVDTEHFIQNIGDGTYFHSGALALRASIAAGAHMTYKILYNGTVAMTGGQDATGALPVPQLVGTLLLEGATKVIVTTEDKGRYRGIDMPTGSEVWDRERIIEAQEHLRKLPGVTVLVHDQQCAAEKRRDRKRGQADDPPMRIVINERVCEGCGDCGVQSNCLSVQPAETDFGRKTRIHQSSCNLDYSCLQGDCPSFVTVTKSKRKTDQKVTKAAGGARRRPALSADDLPEPTPIVPIDEFSVRMPGIGGTGVVTVAQLIGTAATIAGRHVSGLDQTGLSQKAGPVVSDLRIATHELHGSNKATAGSVDTYLVLDLLVGLSSANVAALSPERSVAIVSTSKTPVGSMIRDVGAKYPETAQLKVALDGTTRADVNEYIDAQAVAQGLFGDTTTANVIVVGLAFQKGCLPLPAEAIEQAIELNGAAIEANKLAFRWGRMLAIDSARVHAAMHDGVADTDRLAARERDLIGGLREGALGALLAQRVPELVAYQDFDYATSYVKTVKRVAGRDVALAEAVARNLFKLMAYKDEYEVARLLTDSAARSVIEGEVGGGKMSYNLHPPVLRSLGMSKKIRLGPWFTPVLRGLAAGKRLRGTKLDLFGYAGVRRTERALVVEYRRLVDDLLANLTPENHSTAVEIAELPDMVRGYEHIKVANVARYRAEVERLSSEWRLVRTAGG